MSFIFCVWFSPGRETAYTALPHPSPGSFCLFATHFHELTHMAAEHSNVRNFHVTADTSRPQDCTLVQMLCVERNA